MGEKRKAQREGLSAGCMRDRNSKYEVTQAKDISAHLLVSAVLTTSRPSSAGGHEHS